MRMVLTLVGPAGQPLDDQVVANVNALLPKGTTLGGQLHHVREAAFDSDDRAGLAVRIDEVLDGQPIDHCFQPEVSRAKKLLIADMDSTMITVECIDELADFAGVKDQVVAITERAMRGEIDFEGALTERVGLMKGLPESALADCFAQRVSLSPGARDLIQAARNAGMHCALVSGGFTYFTERVAGLCGFHENRANGFIIRDGVLTGDVQRPILGRDAKVQALNEICQRLNVSTDRAVAIGDGANDIGMIEAAGLGVAYHAKPVTRAAAAARIDHGGLDVLRHFLGV